MLPATSILISEQYPGQYRRPCRRCNGRIWDLINGGIGDLIKRSIPPDAFLVGWISDRSLFALLQDVNTYITKYYKNRKEKERITTNDTDSEIKNSKMCVVTKVALSTFELVTGHVQVTGVITFT